MPVRYGGISPSRTGASGTGPSGAAPPQTACPRRACPAQAAPDGKAPDSNASSCCPARATRARAVRVAAKRQVGYKSTRPRVHAVYTRARKDAQCGALTCCSTHPGRTAAPQRAAARQLESTRLLAHAPAEFRSSSPLGRLCSASPADSPPSGPLADGVSAPVAAQIPAARRQHNVTQVGASQTASGVTSARWASSAVGDRVPGTGPWRARPCRTVRLGHPSGVL